MGRGMIPVPSVPIRIGFLLLVLVVIIHDLVVGVIILTVLRAAGLLAAHVGTGLGTALSWCVLPYIIPDLVKIALALLLSRKLRAILKLS